MLDLSLAKDADDAERILRVEWSRQSEGPTSGVPPMDNVDRLHIGLLFLAYEHGRLSLQELLQRAGSCADGSGDALVPECEAFYLLLNEIDGGGPVRKSSQPLPDRVRDLFAPMASEARLAVPHLPAGAAAG